MNINTRTSLRQRLKASQVELIDCLKTEQEPITPALARLTYTLVWIRLEEFVREGCGIGCPPHARFALANAFVAKIVLRLATTVALIDRLKVDISLRRICGFPRYRLLPSESTFSRAFEEFAKQELPQRVHEALIKEQLGQELIGHIARDATAIEARERPTKGVTKVEPQVKQKRGRPSKAQGLQPKPPKEPSAIERQRGQSLEQMMSELPNQCDTGVKCNAKGYKTSWNGYKLHLDTADCGVPISAILSSASVYDSRVAVPLSILSAQRVTNLYDLMDAAYCSSELRQHSVQLNHMPLIDHNRRGGEKIEFTPAQAQRYKERTVAERMNARLKDEFGGNNVWVRGAVKVSCHLMFGMLALSADQLMRLLQ